jgi:hypothetical protein
LGRGKSDFARAGIGISAVHDDRASTVLSKVEAVELHGRGSDTIPGKDSGDRPGDSRHD